jgi:K+-sensing histidine kinase KdpD
VKWKIEAGKGSLNIDPQLLQDAVLEVFRNAFEHLAEGSSIDFIARTEGDNLVLTFHEPKPDFSLETQQWGREPLRHVNRGHYGLGLSRARTIIEEQTGKLEARYDSTASKLVTNITLPLSSGAA